MQRFTGVVKHLIIINVLFFIAKQSLGLDSFALHFPLSDSFEPYQVITHMFMHGNLMHILFNMFALWMFGSAVESVWGPQKFLFFYLAAGFGAMLFSLGIDYFQYSQMAAPLNNLNLSSNTMQEIMRLDIVNGNMYSGALLQEQLPQVLSNEQLSKMTNVQFGALFELNIFSDKAMLGASGAIMGILVAFGMLFPNAELMLLFFPVPIKAKYFIPVIVGMDIFSGITGVSIFSPSNTAYWAHVGGALAGLIMVLFWKRTQFDNNRWN